MKRPPTTKGQTKKGVKRKYTKRKKKRYTSVQTTKVGVGSRQPSTPQPHLTISHGAFSAYINNTVVLYTSTHTRTRTHITMHIGIYL